MVPFSITGCPNSASWPTVDLYIIDLVPNHPCFTGFTLQNQVNHFPNGLGSLGINYLVHLLLGRERHSPEVRVWATQTSELRRLQANIGDRFR